MGCRDVDRRCRIEPLWARVVTPTDGVPHQHSKNETSSPAAARHDPSPVAERDARAGHVAEHHRLMPSIRRVTLALVAAATLVLLTPLRVDAAPDGAPDWRLPAEGANVVAPFEAPAHDYGAGHRGIDIGPVAGPVVAPAAGVVAFAGTVVDRGVVTIDHGGGWVTSVEPIAPSVAVGDAVAAGDPIGTVSTGGHAPAGALHVGVRLEGEYVNPLLLLGRVPRAILLPCC